MIPELIWIVGFYMTAAAMAHRLLRQSADERQRHYVLVAGNHQMQIEWYIRSLQRFSRYTGMDIGITVVLEDSCDETGKITEIFARGYDKIRLLRAGEPAVAEVAAAEDEQDAAVMETDRDIAMSRERMLRQMADQGIVASPLQIVWVELSNREDLARLPLGCRYGGNRIQ
ncbi:hypothetical protein E5161_12145 [Cohnella pontilimi]|uniref:Uncharacterized protein n=1 Tax=Cohnella pontilimi TaxID=2564100 RepID=A0A4U0FB83_9BACL|nr:hypothetical protein [Cohnella pontilimi]TJY41941.1 hypothetical protein E5161_12145 [Cohnella pontilimi]